MVLMCNFGPVLSDIEEPGVMAGPLSVAPEMTKNRFVVVMTPGVSRYGTCVVVPLSTKEPKPAQKHHHCILAGSYPFLGGDVHSWVKGDMVTTVSYARLDRVRLAGRFISPSLSNADFDIVKGCVKHALMI
ncbi:type II toxin-antitoxin system PemK/MazF family toxin [Pararhizobium sp. O133]|uniref:type II toxin-antitoxin system PemK/MazF family toxin n=1 Tax=Pararhizobium sp. O133 TaxID=3449278 RepID=UPI003F682590